MKVKIVFDKTSQLVWAVKVIEPGEQYGWKNSLLNDGTEPLIEFYDARYSHSDLGQFVSRYELSTLLAHSDGGLCLNSDSQSWTIYEIALGSLIHWLKQHYPQS